MGTVAQFSPATTCQILWQGSGYIPISHFPQSLAGWLFLLFCSVWGSVPPLEVELKTVKGCDLINLKCSLFFPYAILEIERYTVLITAISLSM